MGYMRASAGEFLVVGRRGRLRHVGSGGSAWPLPGSTWGEVPRANQEGPFGLTLESKHGIPLRLQGIVLYPFVDPVAAARDGADLTIYGAEAAWAPMRQTLVDRVGRGLEGRVTERAS